MKLANFLNNLFKQDGFVLVDANYKKYVIGISKIIIKNYFLKI